MNKFERFLKDHVMIMSFKEFIFLALVIVGLVLITKEFLYVVRGFSYPSYLLWSIAAISSIGCILVIYFFKFQSFIELRSSSRYPYLIYPLATIGIFFMLLVLLAFTERQFGAQATFLPCYRPIERFDCRSSRRSLGECTLSMFDLHGNSGTSHIALPLSAESQLTGSLTFIKLNFVRYFLGTHFANQVDLMSASEVGSNIDPKQSCFLPDAR
jgi:hypothetical protein